MTAKAFVDKNPKASEEQIQQALSGVLCRCFTSARMIRAIERYGEELARWTRSELYQRRALLLSSEPAFRADATF